ncbi:hypothetical protein EX30DRAFT_375392 [Ascodesmis nigricans]|uniref:Uncharacterized protein n=1 Tax=Ascodesmis nigricans TaxID=341454 RepID=A0A4S2MPZ4_9PEZI|nr:hypothetical protein EX30DRAFT_375392 [Ascodesmis nigricans]
MTNPDIQWTEEKPLHSYSTRSEGAANTPKTNLERLIRQSEQKGEQVDKREIAIIQEAVGLQAENAILKARLEAYEKAPPVASCSQKSLGTGKYMTLRERKIARDAKIAEEKHKNVRKGTGRGRKRKACERDIIAADDSDVERQVAGLEAEDEEEEGVQQPPKRASRAT